MVQEIDVARVRQYNLEYNKCKEKAMQLNAEREMNKKEIDSLCAELSAELGIQVTLENIESIYNDKVDKINADLSLGESIIKRIEAEENQLGNNQTVGANVGAAQGGVAGGVQPVQPQINLVPPQTCNQGAVQNPGYIVPPQGQAQFTQPQIQYPVQPQGAAGGVQPVVGGVQPVQNGQSGFSSLSGLPNTEIKIEPPQGTASSFIQYASNNQNPVIPQMFARGAGDVPPISTADLDDVEVI